MALRVRVVAETAPGGERASRFTPEIAARLVAEGLTVLVESGAGSGAALTDDQYAQAGAEIATRARVYDADVLLSVGRPALELLRPDQTRYRARSAHCSILQAMAALAKLESSPPVSWTAPRTLTRGRAWTRWPH